MKEKEVEIREGNSRPDAHPPEVRVPRDGKVSWRLAADAKEWVVLMDGETPFVGDRALFSGRGNGSRAGGRIDRDRVEEGDSFKYWIFWRDSRGAVQSADPRIVISDRPV